jgi:hypothetical protein
VRSGNGQTVTTPGAEGLPGLGERATARASQQASKPAKNESECVVVTSRPRALRTLGPRLSAGLERFRPRYHIGLLRRGASAAPGTAWSRLRRQRGREGVIPVICTVHPVCVDAVAKVFSTSARRGGSLARGHGYRLVTRGEGTEHGDRGGTDGTETARRRCNGTTARRYSERDEVDNRMQSVYDKCAKAKKAGLL